MNLLILIEFGDLGLGLVLYANIYTFISTIQIYFGYLKDCSTVLNNYKFCFLFLYNIEHFRIFKNINF